MRYNTEYVYTGKCEFTSYIRNNKKFGINTKKKTLEYSDFDKETLMEYLIQTFDVFTDEEGNAKKPEKDDVEYYYGYGRDDYDKLLNYFEVRYDLYLEVIKKLEEIENNTDNNEFTIQFTKDNCKYFDERNDEFIESYLTIKVEKEQVQPT